MFNPRRIIKKLIQSWFAAAMRDTISSKAIRARPQLEPLEPRLAPASFYVNPRLQITRLDNLSYTGTAQAVVFFESAVTDYQVLRQGLAAETDAVVLDSDGDGLQEMDAFLASRHDLTSIGLVTHGSPGVIALGTAALD